MNIIDKQKSGISELKEERKEYLSRLIKET